MRAVGLVSEHLHTMGMGDLDDRLQIGADAVVRWIVNKHRLRIWMRLDRFFHILDLHAERDPQPLVQLWIDVDRLRINEHKRIDDTAVHIARQNDLVSRRDDR